MLLKKRIPFKFLISQVKSELIFVTLYSVILGVDHRYFGLETTIPMAVPSILGGAISLIIAFRLKQSYDRWWEARKIWGAIVNDSRTLIRNVITFTHLKQETLKDSKEDNIFVERQVAWCYSLSQGLRGINPLKGIREILKTDPDDYEYIKHHYNVPNALFVSLMKKEEAVKQESLMFFTRR